MRKPESSSGTSFEEVFEQHRPLLFSIAYRMLGSAMDAEDVLQETYLRWLQAGEVQSPKAFLATIATRLSIDRLREAQAERKAYVGTWLPEPIRTDTDSVATLELSESLSVAFLTVLETLTPVERAVFLLHEVFDYGFAEIASIVGKTEANCRQLLRRARRSVAEQRPRFTVTREQHLSALSRFAQACVEGNMDDLIALLTADAVDYSDGGGKRAAALNRVFPADKVARYWLGVVKKVPPDLEHRLEDINGQPALVSAFPDGTVYSVLFLDLVGDAAGIKVRGTYIILNPDKLRLLSTSAPSV